MSSPLGVDWRLPLSKQSPPRQVRPSALHFLGTCWAWIQLGGWGGDKISICGQVDARARVIERRMGNRALVTCLNKKILGATRKPTD